MRDLRVEILEEFVSAARTVCARELDVAEAFQSPRLKGADYRALGLCPDCGQAPESERMRCDSCAKNHAIKCADARRKAKGIA